MLECEVQDGVAWLTLKRPEVLNVINREMASAFRRRLEEIGSRSDVRVVVTRGAGRAYCAGSDLRRLASLSVAEAAEHELELGKVFSTLDRLPQPTIAMLHGHILGGGLGLALYHDFRIASETASFGMPEVDWGWVPPWAVGRLVETVGFSRARSLLMTCIRMSGKEAVAANIVHEAVPEERLQSRVEDLARQLAAKPVEGLIQTKALLNRMSPLRQIEWDVAASEGFKLCFAKSEAQKRVKEFLERKSRH
jgi:enoyl-CoA hydratase/carnithine racemase